MNRMPKNILIISILLTVITSISNYSKSSENIDDLGYVMAIGIDAGTNSKYKVSFLLSTIESSASEAFTKSSSSGTSSGESGSSKFKSSQSEFEVYTVECNSIDTAVNICDTFVNKDLTLSHCKMLIISDTIAKQGIKSLVNVLVNKVEIRPDCNIIISKILEEKFEGETPPNLEDIITKYYDVTSNTETNTAYNQSVKLLKFYLNLRDSLSQPYASLGIISNPKKNAYSENSGNSIDAQSRSLVYSSSEYSVETMGLSVFKSDVLVGNLTGIENMCHLMITNNFENCIINIPNPINPGETIDIYIFGVKDTKTQVKILNDSPFVSSNISIAARILSTNDISEVLTQEKLDIIENATTEYIKEQIYNYFDKTSKQFESDISGIGRYAIKNFKTISEWNNYNWLENYKNSTFKVNVKVSMRTGILLTTE